MLMTCVFKNNIRIFINKENDKISQISPYYEIILGLKYTNLQKYSVPNV